MDKDFAPYREALELNQLGFNEHCFAWHVSETYGLEIGEVTKDDLLNDAVLAPTYSQAFRWFREKCLLEGVVEQANDFYWYKFSIYFYGKENKQLLSKGVEFKTYEEAELACLIKLIEILKNK